MAMVAFALDAFQKGRKIFSNIQLGFGHEPLEFSDIKLKDGRSIFWNGHINIDELNFYFDGRRSGSGANVQAAAFLLQQKKQGCNLTGTTHNIDYLDLRLREHYDFVVRPQVYPAFPATPVLLKMVVENGPLQRNFRRTLVLDCRPLMGLYDTRAVYDPFKKQPKHNEDLDEDDEVDRKPKRRYRIGF